MNKNITNVLSSTGGKAQEENGESLGTFLASLTVSGIIFGLGITTYTFLKLNYSAL
jgi:hypothetical protein